MEKIFKKSLALVLSAALCLTALVGCLTVSAADETTTPIYEMVGAEGKAGETVTVTANLQNIEGICAHHVKFTFAKELTVVSMYDVTRGRQVVFNTDAAEGENFQFKKSIDTNTGVTTVEDVNILNFVKSDNTYDEHTPSLTLTFSVKIADGTADGNYAVNVTATAADQGEAWVNTIDFRNSNVVVKNTVAPVVDENIAFTRSLNLASDFSMNFLVKTELMSGYDVDSIYAVIYRDVYTFQGVTPENPTSDPETVRAVLNGNRYQFKYTGLAAREMTAKIYCTVYGTKDGVLYRSETYSSSIQDWCIAASKSNTAAGQKEHTIAANLAWYGARAQQYTNYNLDNLADAGEMAQYIDRRTVASEDSFVDNKVITSNPSGVNCVTKWSRSLFLTDTLGLNFKISLSSEYAAKYENLKLRYSYTSDDENQIITEDVSLDKNGDFYVYAYYGLKSYEFDTPVSVALYEGDTQVSDTYTTAVVDWCAAAYKSLGASNAQGALAAAIYSYCIAANSRFGK